MKKRLFAGLLALCMVFNLMPATAFAEETTAEPVVTEVVCEAAEDCTAETHIETCAKYVAPVVVCEAAEDCAAEEHIEICAKYVAPVVVCEAAEDCTAETHIEGCAKYVIPCTYDEECLADEHTEGCPADVVYLPCPTEGCELVEGHAGECTGQTTYDETAEDKLRVAVANGGEVILEQSVVLTDTLTIPKDVEVILNLNGNTISQEKECTTSYSMIENKGNLIITGNGKISFKDTSAGDPSFGWGSYTIRNEGTFVVENGTIEHLGEQNGNGSVKHMYCAIYQYSGTTTIKGGTISTPTYRSVRLWKGDMTIKGGTFEGQLWVQCVDDSATLKIEEGTFAPRGVDGSSVFIGNVTDSGKLCKVEVEIVGGTFNTKIGANNVETVAGAITGGTFTEAAKNGTNSTLVNEDYTFVKNTDGLYDVVVKPYIAQVGNEKYKTLEEAINVADGKTVTIINNVEITNTITVPTGKTVTVDLNGYSITGTPAEAKAYAVIENKGNLTITGEGAIVCNHTLAGSTGYAVNTIANSGTLIVNGGTIENKSTAAYQIGYAIDNNSTSYDAVLVINGGTVKASGSAYYDGIRQFCNSLTAVNSVEVKSGSVSTIWLQNPSDGSSERNTKDVKGSVSITGGTVDKLYLEPSNNFEAAITGGYIASVSNNETSEGRNLVKFITGGYFVYEPASGYIADGLSALLTNVKKDGVSYLYEIGVKPQGEPEKAITPAEPKTESKLPETATTEQKNAATQITNPDTGNGKGTTSFESVLPEASDVATNMKEEEHTKVVEDLNKELKDKENVQTPVNTEDVTIHVRPYLDVQVEDVKIPAAGSTDAPVVTLDVTMKYDVVASTEKDADKIVTTEDKEQDLSKTVNAVVTEEGKTLNVEKGTEVEITVPLPEVFSAYTDKIIVKHVKDDGTVYYYDAVVNDDGTITFINPNGFSTIIITVDTREAVVEFKTSDSTTETVTYKATDVNTTAFPTAEKTGYSHAGWTFVNVPGTYSGKMTDSLLTLLSALYGSSSTPIVAEPVFVEIPASSGGSSSDDSIAEEVKTEKPVPTASVTKETVETGKDELGALIGDSYGLFRLALSVKLEGELERATDIKIKVDGLTKADSIIVLQKTNEGWQAVPAIARDGYVICKFTSLSETLIFVNENGEVEAAQMAAAQPTAQAAGTTPAVTGDSANSLAYISMITVAAAGLAVLFFRRRRA